MISQEVKDVCKKINKFYLKKNLGHGEVAERELLALQITKVRLSPDVEHPDTVEITTNRPGLLIGKLGQNIDDLSKFLGMKIKIREEMDHINNYLIPCHWDTSWED